MHAHRSFLLSCSVLLAAHLAALPAHAAGETPPPAHPPARAPGSVPGEAATPTPSPATTATVPAVRPPVREIVAKIQKVYEGTGSLKAHFAQTLTGPMGKRQASGTLYLKKPGKMRWDYEKPEKKLFVADGTTLWMYEPEDEQAFKQPLSSSQLPAQVSFLFGRGKLLDEFEVSYLDGQGVGEPGDIVLKLIPKVATAQYRYLVFVVNPRTFLVSETFLYDQQGGSNHLVFSGVDTNVKGGIDDARFRFTPPPGTKIISPH